MQTNPRFSLSLLTLALCGGFAQAADTDAAQDASSLETVHVRGQGVSATHRVNTRSMDESTSTDMKDVLSAEPAVSFGGGNGTSQWVTIRGMGQDQIDVKVDDTYSDTQLFHHNGRFLFDPALVKVIGVQKGTGSASAGIGATSGAVIAQTIDAKDLLLDGQDFGFKVNAGVSSNKGWNRGFSAYGRAGGFDAVVAANWVTEKDYKPGKGYAPHDHSSRVHNSALGQRGLLGKISYNFNEDHRLTLSHRQEKTYGTRALREEFDFSQACKTRGRGGPIIYNPDGSCVPDTENNSPIYRTLTHDTTNLEYLGHNIGFISQAQANVYRKVMNRDEASGSQYELDAKVRTTGANLKLDSRLFDRHTLKYGINWRHQEAEPRTLKAGLNQEKKTDTGFYLEGIWDIEPVTLTTGLRYDRFNATFSNGKASGHNVNPSIGAIYDITPELSLNASLNYASRSPRLTEVALSGGRYSHISGDLKAERSRNAEVGVKYNWNNALSLNASYFNQQIKDVQAVKNLPTKDHYLYYNGGTLKNSGYELGAAYRWQGLTARAGVAYNKPKMAGASLDSIVTAIPMGRTWTTSLSYRFDNPNLEIGWRGRYVQKSVYDTGTSQRGSGGTNTVRPGYGVNDIFANWKPTGKDDLNVNFAVNNVGNKLYKPHSQRSSARDGSSLPEVGRDFRLSVNYKF